MMIRIFAFVLATLSATGVLVAAGLNEHDQRATALSLDQRQGVNGASAEQSR
jgi:hypothetical protein